MIHMALMGKQYNHHGQIGMDQKGVKERFRAPGQVSKCTAAEDATQRFQFRLAEMRQGEGNGLQQDGVRPGDTRQGEEEKSAKEEFPTDHADRRVEDETLGRGGRDGIELLELFQAQNGRQDQGDGKDAEGACGQPKSPIAGAKTIFRKRLAENNQDEQRRQGKVEEQAVPGRIFEGVLVMIDAQDQCR